MSKSIEKIFSAPSFALDNAVKSLKKIGKATPGSGSFKKAHGYWNMLGPGLITGAADDDPSGIATYSQAGAQYGFQLIWLAGLTFPLMSVVQEMCARIGLVTGRGLAGTIRINYPQKVLYVCTALLFIANTLNLGADFGAMAQAVELVFPGLNFYVLVIFFGVLCLLLQVYTSYEQYAKYLKWMALVLLSYVFSALLISIDARELLKATFIPSMTFSRDQIFLITAILGTTISPYLFFWQTSQEIEEEILKGKTSVKLREGATKDEISHMRIDVWSGMFISNMVMFFIIAACAATLYSNGIYSVTSAADAALALKPIAGEFTFILFAIGIVGAGLLAVPVLAGSAAYTFAETFNWKSGLYRKLTDAPAFYGVIIVSMVIGMAINFFGFDPIKVLIYSAVVNGLVAPVVLVLIVQIAGNKRIMGRHVNGWFTQSIGWLVVTIMTVAGIATIWSMFF
ncbi:MAG: divalent metal cation transporter [bacterium]|nr:divalent metal cation transporter [bacterium]